MSREYSITRLSAERRAYARGKADALAELRPLLRRVVDLTWGIAHEDESVPATKVADAIIDQAQREDGRG